MQRLIVSCNLRPALAANLSVNAVILSAGITFIYVPTYVLLRIFFRLLFLLVYICHAKRGQCALLFIAYLMMFKVINYIHKFEWCQTSVSSKILGYIIML